MSLWEGRGRQAKQTTPEGKRNDLLCFFGVGAAGIIAISLKALLPSARLYDSSVLFWLGIAFVWLGMLLRHWAVMTLGRYHVMTIYAEPKQPVIERGPYKYIRHPSYLGALTAIIGIALAINSIFGSILLVTAATIALIQRINLEDRYLIKHLGTTYEEYAKRTFRLVPFVW